MGTERPKVPTPTVWTDRTALGKSTASHSHSPAQGEPFLPLGLDRHPFTDFVPP